MYLGDTESYAASALAPAAGATILQTNRIGRTAEYRMQVNLSLAGGAPVAADYANYIFRSSSRRIILQLAAFQFTQDIDRVLIHANDQLSIVAVAAGSAGVIVIAQIILTPLTQMGV